MESYIIAWVVVAAVFAGLELATSAFVALYFAVGSIAAAIVAAFDIGLSGQLAAFSITGIALLVATRPILKHRLEVPGLPMNVHAIVGKGGMVTIAVDNDHNTGQIRVGTEFWTARLPEGASGQTVPVGARVTVVSVEGVTARVAPVAASVSPTAGPETGDPVA